MMRTKQMQQSEIFEQALAIARVASGTSADELAIIAKYATEWRNIITDFERELGRAPTSDEIIWVTGVHHNYDPTTTI